VEVRIQVPNGNKPPADCRFRFVTADPEWLQITPEIPESRGDVIHAAQRRKAICQRVVKSIGASNEAGQVDVEHLSEIGHSILSAPIKRDPLRLHEDVESGQPRIRRLDGRDIRDIDLPIYQSSEFGAFFTGIVGRAGACPPDMDLRAVLAECLRSRIADAAGAAHDQNSLSGEVQLQRRLVLSVRDRSAAVPTPHALDN
jgi:hypothetical protein